MNERLYRSRDDRVIGGVCSGVAERLDLDPSLVRVGWVILTVLTGGAFLLLYIVMLIVVPEEPLGGVPPMPPPPGPDAMPGWQAPGAEQTTGWPVAGAPTSAGTAGEPGPADAGAPVAGWQAPGTTGAGAPPSAPPPGAPAPAWTPPDQAYASRRAARAERRRQREGIAGLVVGLLLILLGAWFLFREYLPEIDWDLFWPVAIIALGVLFLVLAVRPRRGGDAT